MRDPEMVSRANAAAVTLERAWERWRIVHGLPATARSPVSSYVGYSIEEPWGSPRVVFGVDAGEAELLAALLEHHECTGQSYQPGPAASVLDQPGHAGDTLYRATRPRLAGPQRAERRPPVTAAASPPPSLPAAPARPPAGVSVPAAPTPVAPDGAEPGAGQVPARGQPAADHAVLGERPPAQDAEIPGQGSLLPDAPAPAEREGDRAGGLLRAAGGEPVAAVPAPAAGGAPARPENVAGERDRGDAGDRGDSGDHDSGDDTVSPGELGGPGDPGGDGDRGRPGGNRAAARQERPSPARTGRGKGGTESIAAELAGWASGELPGQASARLAAWQAIGGVPAADVREGSATSLRPAGLGAPLDTPEVAAGERGAAELGTAAEPVR